MSSRLILALDVDSKEEALTLVRQLLPVLSIFKIGPQLFTRYGPDMVREVRSLGGEVFLDLKFHDIPNTVANAVRSASAMGVRFLTLHTSGGREMIRAAAAAAGALPPSCEDTRSAPPLLLGITVLTSLDNENLRELGYQGGILPMVQNLTRMAREGGLDGVVASPHEIRGVREVGGRDFLIVTPGIRTGREPVEQLPGLLNDQKRTMTPREALEAGADYLVVGRSILRAKDRVQAALELVKEIQ